jgi:LmbE family N-acetylglucosaminyl deacetylase
MAQFQFTRKTARGVQRTSCLAEAMGLAELANQTWLFVSPHDDDLCIGAGLFMQAAIRAGVAVQVLIVTDGCMGYCQLEDRDRIVEIRRGETYRAYQTLGISPDQVSYIGYPDGGLMPFIGRRRARDGEDAIAGYSGLQNALTYHLRRARPARVYVPTHTDLHPDHRIAHSELMISVFHAAGLIWPELGEPLREPPSVGELAVYCDFVDLPNLEIIGDEEVFQNKLKSITAFQSQVQIERLVDSLRRAGPYEYVRENEFRLFTPDTYKPLFASYLAGNGGGAGRN